MCGFVRDFASLRRRAVDAVDQALCSSMLSSAGRAVVALVCVYVRVCVRVCVSVCVAVLGSGCKSIANIRCCTSAHHPPVPQAQLHRHFLMMCALTTNMTPITTPAGSGHDIAEPSGLGVSPCSSCATSLDVRASPRSPGPARRLPAYSTFVGTS